MLVGLLFFNIISQSWTKAKKFQAQNGVLAPTLKPDGDNCLKVICDALNKIVWVDDVLVIDKRVHKYFAEQPRVEVCVTALTDLVAV